MQKDYSVQINGLIKSDAQDRITEKSLLINLCKATILFIYTKQKIARYKWEVPTNGEILQQEQN